METIKSLRIKGESVYVHLSEMYLWKSEDGKHFLELSIITSEEDQSKWSGTGKNILEFVTNDNDKHKVELELYTSGVVVPALYFTGIVNVSEFPETTILTSEEHEERGFPLEDNVDLSDIRKYKMPYQEETFLLPIDQIEWFRNKESRDKIVEQAIYEYMGKIRTDNKKA